MTNQQIVQQLVVEADQASTLCDAVKAAANDQRPEAVTALARDAIDKLVSVIQYATLANKDLRE